MADTSFDGIYNFRDVGAAINALRHAPLLQEKTLYRSGRLDDASIADRARLIDEYGLATVVDLRTKSEHIKQKQTQRPRLDVWKTVQIYFVSRRFEMYMLGQLAWWQILQFLLFMLFRFRLAAIRILGQNVLGPRGLVGLSKDSLRFCQPEICAALDVLVLPQYSAPVLVHCTQGKDRSGLVVMLALFAVGVPLELVRAEYALSDAGLAPVRASMIKEVEEIGMDEAYTRAPPEVVEAVWNCLEEEYGGVEAYLDLIRFTLDKRRTLKKILLV
ncbi:Tyrosine serine protein [Mycena chlorophos]|uniref:Tyrosine serine protein n=1 Tax=Mycena chlorophos TaxID=658473 RepID=A0A8H6TPY8_MYCCL|nr:Tyrosine serine protein [Mycena chlorophos]